MQFAKRVVGRKMYGGQSTYIPLKVNGAGVIPIIFASSVLYLPVIIAQILPVGDATAENPNWAYDVQQFVDQHLTQADVAVLPGDLRPADHPASPTSTRRSSSTRTSRPTRSASRVASSPASGPATRPSGTWRRSCPASRFPGALFVASIALIPAFVLGKVLGDTSGGQQLGFFGISILIAVGVALETDEADRQPADDAQLRGLLEHEDQDQEHHEVTP